ncbi:MAG: FkbM family methyltransferase, partial [bacterium]|nr:FkbM family methyltransferase [bacterium]
VVVLLAGLALAYGAAPVSATLWAASVKLRGRAPDCSWMQIITMQSDMMELEEAAASYQERLQSAEFDEAFGIELIRHPERDFWIKRDGDGMNGKQLLAWLSAERDWMSAHYAEPLVHPGDFVLDCGAHVGVLTHRALALGAEKVVAVEPDPTQIECLRRNFAAEIQDGRVTLVQKGVWREEGSLSFSVGTRNSGMSSIVLNRGGTTIEIPVTTIDQIVSDLRLPRVDLIKLDIEGAEREALKGATQTLREFRPRVLADTYQRRDDASVLPELIARVHDDYLVTCGPCEPMQDTEVMIVPHFAVIR